MTGYCKGFGVSFILHAAVLALCLTLGGRAAERDLLVVDFSGIALGEQQEGGALRGPGAEPKAPTAAAEAEAATAPKALEGAPEPVPAPGPEPALKAKPRQAPAKTSPKAASKPAAQQAAAPGAQTGGGGTADGRGSAPGTGTGRKEGLAQGYVKDNFNYIMLSIRRNLDYPSQARRMNFTGVSKFSFIIKPDGSIEELTLEESSGHRILDEAARKAIQRAAPFPAPPVPARLIIPIKFSLRG